MKNQTTLAELYIRSLEIQKFKNNYPTVSMMMASRMGEFEKRNFVYLKILDEGIEKLYEANVTPKEGGGWENEEVEGKKKLKFLSPEHETAFNEGWKALMEKPCQITI
jgi:hypothetical protein